MMYCLKIMPNVPIRGFLMNKKIIYLASMALLTACAPKVQQLSELEAPPKNLETQTAQADKLKSSTPISSFNISGAIAAKSHKKGWTATINWAQQDANHYQIRFMGPLGGQTVIIEKQNSIITYREGNKKLSSTNGDDLLQKQTGIRLPVNNLYYWVRGIPAPGSVQSSSHNSTGQLTSLDQAGYHINYTQYITVNNQVLPSKIRLEGHDLMIKMVIKHF